jgi:methionyl-tRNA formyltransferase
MLHLVHPLGVTHFVRHGARRGWRNASNSPSLRVCFFGTDDFSMPTLLNLHASSQNRGPFAGLVAELGVVTPGLRPSGGKGLALLPVAEFANDARIQTWFVPWGMKSLKQWEPGAQTEGRPLKPWDLGVIVSFGYKVPRHILDTLTWGAINLHPSLLPRYRGAAPIPHTLLNGDTSTAVSIIRVDKDVIDGGDILLQEPVSIGPEDTASR